MGLILFINIIDPNFFIPETKYSDKPYLIIECDDNVIHHDANLTETGFDESGDNDDSTGYNIINSNSNTNNNITNNSNINDDKS